MRDSYVDWLHDLPFHEYNAEHWTRSVVHISLVYVIPWLTLFVITAVAWSQYHVRACLWPETPPPVALVPALFAAVLSLWVVAAFLPAAASHYHDGFQTIGDKLREVQRVFSDARDAIVANRVSVQEIEDGLVRLAPHYASHLALGFKLQRARIAAERALISDEDTEHIMDLVATLGMMDRDVSRDAVAFYSVTWIAYVFAAFAMAAPVAAALLRRRAGVRADASSARRDAVLSVLNDVPFVALLYIWLFLAAMAPVNVIAAESCYDWAATVALVAPTRARFWFYCGGADDDDAGAHEIPNVGQRAFSDEWREDYAEMMSAVRDVLGFDPAMSARRAEGAAETLSAINASFATMPSRRIAAERVDGCEPTGSTLREVRHAVCSDVVTGMLWHNAALATLGCVLAYVSMRDWLLRFGRSAAEAADARAVDRGEEAFDWESDPEKTPPRRQGDTGTYGASESGRRADHGAAS